MVIKTLAAKKFVAIEKVVTKTLATKKSLR
jgi:hypothetical protein